MAMSKTTDYAELSEWAENEMQLREGSTTARRDRAAAAKGRAALEAALGGPATVERAIRGGRPPLDPDARPGQHSRSRTIRLTTDLNDRLDALATEQHRRPSDIMREALDDYLKRHRAS
jgi:hypothetical protein